MSSILATVAREDLPPAKPNHDHTRKPTSKLGIFFWRRRMWFESTFVLSMLEPWEKILLLTGFALLCIMMLSAILKYLPQHLMLLCRRATYYLWGQEGDERLLQQWLGFATTGDANAQGAAFGFGLHKEL